LRFAALKARRKATFHAENFVLQARLKALKARLQLVRYCLDMLVKIHGLASSESTRPPC
jgi:hypothetical protein